MLSASSSLFYPVLYKQMIPLSVNVRPYKRVGNLIYYEKDSLPINVAYNPIRMLANLPANAILSPHFLVLLDTVLGCDVLVVHISNTTFNILLLHSDGSYDAVVCTSPEQVSQKAKELMECPNSVEKRHFQAAEEQYKNDAQLKGRIERKYGPVRQENLAAVKQIILEARKEAGR